ncbi:MAG: alanine racemase [Oscillospiraceae bacterium]|nr:alanine racemase [Oscillospiraceae bacterium]
MQGIRKRTWAEINLDHAAWNYTQIRKAVRPDAKVCCVIKANGYGHNAVRLAALYETLGADFLAVSNLEEALQLRQNQITLPILILGYTPPECAAVLAKQNISQCVYSRSYGEALSQAAMSDGVRVKMHIKIDSGMGRIGFQHRGGHSELTDALAVCKLPCLKAEGIFTHFAVADDGEAGEAFTAEQYRNFIDAIEHLESSGIHFALRHCANSAAIFDKPEIPGLPDVHLDMVRAGVVLYGLKPSEQTRNLPELKPVMALKSVISHIKTIQTGDTVSYGRTFTADSPRVIATVPIGYADGFWRLNSNGNCKMLVRDQLCPLVGRVCMDQLMLDITDAKGLSTGDIVTVFGDEAGLCSADQIAANTGTINYEVVCAVGERVPRFFLKDGLPVDVSDNIWKR